MKSNSEQFKKGQTGFWKNKKREKFTEQWRSNLSKSHMKPLPINKICKKCGIIKPATVEFYYFTKNRPNGYCRVCNNSKEKRDRGKEYNQKIRLEVLQAYSGINPKCNCCGEKIIEFLGIDHINGGGSSHRKQLVKDGTTIYLWLRKNNYPEGYRVLCHNCNLAMGYYGKCPHSIKT